MPEINRGVAVAYCDPPGPLEPRPLPTFIAVSPTPSDWPADRVASFYREYNRHMVHNLMVHEAMPGHYLQLAHARRFTGSTRVRAALWSGSFVEGWAVYAEELMADHEYPGEGDPAAVRMQQLKMQLRMVINAILDARVHAHGLTEAQAMALMTERGFQEEGEAAGKWRRAQLTSAQLSTYYVGYTEVSDLAARARQDRPGAQGPARPHARPRLPARPPPPHPPLTPPTPPPPVRALGATGPPRFGPWGPQARSSRPGGPQGRNRAAAGSEGFGVLELARVVRGLPGRHPEPGQRRRQQQQRARHPAGHRHPERGPQPGRGAEGARRSAPRPAGCRS